MPTSHMLYRKDMKSSYIKALLLVAGCVDAAAERPPIPMSEHHYQSCQGQVLSRSSYCFLLGMGNGEILVNQCGIPRTGRLPVVVVTATST